MNRPGRQSSPDKGGAVGHDLRAVTGNSVRRRQPTARQQMFEIVGLMYEQVRDLEVLAADVQVDEVDQLVDVVRFDVRRLGDRLMAIQREEESVR